MSSPANARLAVSISYSTHPNAQMSARLSTALPRACSGDMYAAVPRIIPACVIAGVVIVGACDMPGDIAPVGSSAFARPKSSTFTTPSGRSLMLAGLRSRWMMPCSCAASRASAICLAMGSASSTGIAPWAIRSASVGPSTSSMTRALAPSASSRPWNLRDVRVVQCRKRLGFALEAGDPFGVSGERRGQDLDRHITIELRIARAVHLPHSAFADLREDAVRADRVPYYHGALAMASADALKSALRACARTEAGPPAPIWAAISYGPRRVPGVKATAQAFYVITSSSFLVLAGPSAVAVSGPT